jgi:D-ribulokinase
MPDVVIGLDLGTQGVRALAVNPRGEVLAAAQQLLAVSPALPPGWFEQDPADWWRAACACLRQVVNDLPPATRVDGIAVDSTSGTILPLDGNGQPLYPALMYNDNRSEAQSRRVQVAAQTHQERFGIRFGSSFALPKLLWFKEEQPEIFACTARFLHAADYLAGCLSGEFRYSDASNALKTGYDLIENRWPDFIAHDLDIPLRLLPEVLPIGAPLGAVCQRAGDETGLPPGTLIYAGATDGTAAQFASGAAQPGEWNSTLGTTLVFKGVSRELRLDPLGRVYSHRHPEGWWMPGGASSTGTDWIQAEHPGADLSRLDQAAEQVLPTRWLRYPLLKPGERFPFLCPNAAGFFNAGPGVDEVQRYAAGLEGLALLERLGYETLAGIGLEVGPRIYLTGGGAKSDLWSRLRASVLQKELLLPQVPETAFGAALIAASGCWYSTLGQAARQMVRIARTVAPDSVWGDHYAGQYECFLRELRLRGYLETR